QVHACFNWAATNMLIQRNPFVGRHYGEGEPRKALDDSTLDDVCLRANKQYERSLRFIRLTMCRVGELCGLAWEDVNLERATAILRWAGRTREIGLDSEAIELLREINREQGGLRQGIVFRNTRGRAWNRRTLGQQLRRMKVRHGIKAEGTLHGIRNQGAKVAAFNGAPLSDVS